MVLMQRTEGANNVGGLFTEGPPPTTITADWLNSIQEELCAVVEYSGQAVQTAATDSKSQLLTALLSMIPTYDAVISSQEGWDDIIERTGANAYQFKDDYKSVFVKVADYNLTLSGGDTWGALSTNNVTHLEFEKGAAIQFGNTPGYINCNTTGSILKNVTVKGLGTVASAVVQSFLLAAENVVFDSCKATTRLSNTDMSGFRGSATALHNITSRYINCTATALNSSGIVYGYYLCENVSNSIAYALDTTGASSCYGFHSVVNINSCYAYDIDASTLAAHGMYNCTNISASYCRNIESAAGVNTYGFRNCYNVSACQAIAIDATGAGSAIGFYSCDQLNGCRAIDIDSATDSYGFSTCNQVSGCKADDIDSSGSICYGFSQCYNISSCLAIDIQSAVNNNTFGFSNCNQINGCTVETIDATGTGNAYGFNSCDQISGCYTVDIDASNGSAYGFRGCNRIAACYAYDIDSSAGSSLGFHECDYGAALYTAETCSDNTFINAGDGAGEYSCNTGLTP